VERIAQILRTPGEKVTGQASALWHRSRAVDICWRIQPSYARRAVERRSNPSELSGSRSLLTASTILRLIRLLGVPLKSPSMRKRSGSLLHRVLPASPFV